MDFIVWTSFYKNILKERICSDLKKQYQRHYKEDSYEYLLTDDVEIKSGYPCWSFLEIDSALVDALDSIKHYFEFVVNCKNYDF